MDGERKREIPKVMSKIYGVDLTAYEPILNDIGYVIVNGEAKNTVKGVFSCRGNKQ
ncbi:MAG: hypothetical protein V5A72_00275 [Candidatus Nanohaloarchaea archaeon]